MQKDISNYDLWAQADDLSLGCLLQANHCILVREVGDRSKVFFPLCDLPGSVCIVWPATRMVAPTNGAECWVPKQDAQGMTVEDVHACIVDPERWEALPIQWRGPMGQAACAFGAPHPWTHAVRAYQTGEWDALLKVAARQGFWSLPGSTVKSVASAKI